MKINYSYQLFTRHQVEMSLIEKVEFKGFDEVSQSVNIDKVSNIIIRLKGYTVIIIHV